MITSLPFVDETLCFEQVNHLLPSRMLTRNEWLRQKNVKMGLIHVEAQQPNIITEEMISQDVVGQVFEK